MKPKQQNNPVVLGILGVAFLFILVRIFRTLTGGGDALPPAKPALTALRTASATAPNSTNLAVQPAAMRTRDPFDHPYLLRLAQEEAAKLKHNKDGGILPTPQTHPQSPKSRQNQMTGLPTVAPPLYSTKPILGGFANSTAGNREQGTGNSFPIPIQNPKSQIQTPNDPTTQRPSNPLEKWRVTAILGGSHPRAVVECPEMSPRTVAVGDELRGFRIAAIRPREIVVASAQTVLTLPLETHSDNKDETANKTEQQGIQEAKTLTAAELPKFTEKPNGKTSN